MEDQPIYTVWRRNGGTDADGADSGDELVWTGEGTLLTRPDGVVTWTELDAAGCAFLDACAAGRLLMQAASESLARQASTGLARQMARLLHSGAFLQRACMRHPITDQGASMTRFLSTDTAAGKLPPGLRDIWHDGAGQMNKLVPHDAVALIDRVAIGAIFFLSDRTKEEGWQTVTDSTYTLFRAGTSCR